LKIAYDVTMLISFRRMRFPSDTKS